MGDHHKSRALIAGQFHHQSKHLGGRAAVEVAGGLVGQDTRRLGHQGAGDRHTLALAAREFGRSVVQTLTQTDAAQHGLSAFGGLGSRLAANPQRHGHVVAGAELGQQVVELVDKTQVAVAHVALSRGAQARQVLAFELYLPAARRVQAAQKVQQGAFARARGAHDGQGLPRFDAQVHALQDGHVQAAFGEPFGQAVRLQHSAVGEVTHSAKPPRG